MRVVEGALADAARLVHQLPRRAGIVRAEEAAVVVFDERVDAVRVGAGHRDADLAVRRPAAARRLRVISFHVSPPSVDLNRPLPGPPLDIWYSTRYASHSAANITFGFLRSIAMSTAPVLSSRNEHLLPRLAAVGRLVDAALVARSVPYLPKSATKTMSGLVGWMRIFEIASEFGEADVRPRLAGVGGLVDAVAGHDVAADARLAHADVDDVGVRVGDGDGADRRALDLTVGDRRPRRAAVGRLPEPAADGAEVGLARPAFHAGHGNRAAAAVGADAAPAEGVDDRLIDRVRSAALRRDARGGRGEVQRGGQR